MNIARMPFWVALLLLICIGGLPAQATQGGQVFLEASVQQEEVLLKKKKAKRDKGRTELFLVGAFLFITGLIGYIFMTSAQLYTPWMALIAGILLIAGDFIMCSTERLCILSTLSRFFSFIWWL